MQRISAFLLLVYFALKVYEFFSGLHAGTEMMNLTDGMALTS